MREVLIGFDSAWTDNTRNPGAICAMHLDDGSCVRFDPPHLVTFDQAARFVNRSAAGGDVTLVAIDQPTIVRNETGSRPADKVAASLISRLRGGVQPARRGAGGASMFGAGAPVWRFLREIRAVQNPQEARTSERGRYVIEAFPALSLPALVPQFWLRKRGAKYNPVVRHFAIDDWRLVATGLGRFAGQHGLEPLTDWALEESGRVSPRKADQDRLDAAICLAIAVGWRRNAAAIQFGDERYGYIVGLVSAETRAVLEAAAALRGVPIDRTWTGCALPEPG